MPTALAPIEPLNKQIFSSLNRRSAIYKNAAYWCQPNIRQILERDESKLENEVREFFIGCGFGGGLTLATILSVWFDWKSGWPGVSIFFGFNFAAFLVNSWVIGSAHEYEIKKNLPPSEIQIKDPLNIAAMILNRMIDGCNGMIESWNRLLESNAIKQLTAIASENDQEIERLRGLRQRLHRQLAEFERCDTEKIVPSLETMAEINSLAIKINYGSLPIAEQNDISELLVRLQSALAPEAECKTLMPINANDVEQDIENINTEMKRLDDLQRKKTEVLSKLRSGVYR